MRALLLALTAVLSSLPSRAAAQLANHAISVESGVSTPLGGGRPAGAAFAISASEWLHGPAAADLEGVLRVGFRSAPETTGRGSTGAVLGTAGLRLSLGRAPLRPQLFADLGWAWSGAASAAAGVAFGLGAGLEWFPVPDLSVAVRVAVRGVTRDVAGEGVVAVAAYF